MTAETERQIVALYADGLSAPRILQALGGTFRTPKTIYDILHKHGALVRRPGRIDYATDSCWHEAFATIDTEAQAYWLGMLIADGWIGHGATAETWHVGLQLQERDRQHVEAFRDFLRATQSIIRVGKVNRSTGRTHWMYRLLVNSQRLKQDLAAYGVVQRKSFTTFLPTLSVPLMRHLLRGIMDGDGCIALVRGEPKHAIFYGTERLTGEIAAHLERSLGVRTKTPRPVLSIYGVRWGRQQDVRGILDYLYADATVSLPRKHALYERYVSGSAPATLT